jgi:hypothetical protein
MSTIVHGYQNLVVYRILAGILLAYLSLSGHEKRSMIICMDHQ